MVKKVGSGLKHIGKQMVLKPSVVIGDEDDHTLYDIEEADDISLLMVSKEVWHSVFFILLCSEQSCIGFLYWNVVFVGSLSGV